MTASVVGYMMRTALHSRRKLRDKETKKKRWLSYLAIKTLERHSENAYVRQS